MTTKKLPCLTGASLKWIAMASMLLDHFNKGIIYTIIIVKGYSPEWLNTVSDLLDILGRVAFPIFLFLLTEGFFHTHSKMKYFRNLLLFGILSEIPYDMFESGTWIDRGGQNMFLTLALALATLCCIDKMREMTERKGLRILFTVLITFTGGYLSALAGFDYTYYGIVIPVIFYFTRANRLLGTALGYLCILKELWSFTGFALVNLYNGERGKINKWIGYWFYPVHLLIIGVIRMYVLKA